MRTRLEPDLGKQLVVQRLAIGQDGYAEVVKFHVETGHPRLNPLLLNFARDLSEELFDPIHMPLLEIKSV